MPPLVAEAIGADGTVATAAAAALAVTDAATDVGLVTSEYVEGNKLSVQNEGEPLPWLQPGEIADQNGMSFAMVLEDLVAGVRTVESCARLCGSSFSATPTLLSYSGPDIACDGDSLTSGAGSGTTTYPIVL